MSEKIDSPSLPDDGQGRARTCREDQAFPEHEKLSAIATQSQTCGEFLDWLLSQKYVLAKYHECDESCHRTCLRTEYLYPMNPSVPKLLARFFGIDQDRLEEEKRAMLAAMRTTDTPTPPRSADPRATGQLGSAETEVSDE